MKVYIVDPSKFTYPYDHSLSNALVDQGCDVTLITSKFMYGNPIGKKKYRDFHLFYSLTNSLVAKFFKKGSLPYNIFKGGEHVLNMLLFYLYCALTKPDVIHVQWLIFRKFDMFFYTLLEKRGIKLFYTAHNALPHDCKDDDGWREVYLKFKNIIVHTTEVKEEIKTLTASNNSDAINIIAHGDLSYIHDCEAKSAKWLETLNLNGRSVFLVFGIIKPYKGVDKLIELAVSCDNYFFLVVGKVGDENYYKSVLDRINAEKVQHLFHFHTEFVPDDELKSIANVCDFAVLPYRKIYQSGVFFLLSELGLPIIASNVGSFSCMLSCNRGVVYNGSTSDLLEKSKLLYSKSSMELNEMVLNNKEYIENNYSWQDIARRTKKHYLEG